MKSTLDSLEIKTKQSKGTLLDGQMDGWIFVQKQGLQKSCQNKHQSKSKRMGIDK